MLSDGGLSTRSPPFAFGAGWSSPVARQAHNLKVTGSNPVPATISTCNSPVLVAGVLRLREHAGSQRGGACSDQKSRATFSEHALTVAEPCRPSTHRRFISRGNASQKSPRFYPANVRPIVAVAQYTGPRAANEIGRDPRIAASQQAHLVDPENGYLRRLKRSDSKTRRISSIGRWAQGSIRAVGSDRRFCGARFRGVICIGAPMPLLFSLNIAESTPASNSNPSRDGI